ncbi:Allergen [Penicillium verhagenii]|nr:Allergen [Penicillium verhagenii]
MLFSKSLLLAALSSSAFAARLEGHARRQAVTTTTVTELITITACPCSETSTPVWTSSSVVATTTPECSTTETPTSTPVPTTSAVPTTSTVVSTSSSIVAVTTSYSTIEAVTSTSTIEAVTSTSTIEAVTSTSTIEASTSTSTIEASSSTTTAVASTTSSSSSSAWTEVPSDGVYSSTGFGTITTSSGSGDTYTGNVGSPYGSNIISISESEASSYKYVVQFTGSNTDDWKVVIWNKYSSDGTMDGWYGNACHTFTLAAGDTVYYAFDTDSQGGWTAAKGSSIPTDDYGGYASTWGEFDFGSTVNSGWSGFDVSAIMAQDADLSVQGMSICDAYNSDATCSSITTGAGTVSNAYTSAETDVGGIGGNLSAGPVRLAVVFDYDA